MREHLRKDKQLSLLGKREGEWCMDERYCTDLCVLAPLPIFISFLSITFLNIAVMPKCAEMLGRSNRNLHQSFLLGWSQQMRPALPAPWFGDRRLPNAGTLSQPKFGVKLNSECVSRYPHG